MKIFNIHAGKQHLTCAVISLVMAHMYKIDEWDAILLDSIVAHGHKYYLESVSKIRQLNYELKVEDLRRNCTINNFVFDVTIKPIIYGKLYDEDRHNFNLNRALNYLFRNKNLSGVILQCNGKFLAVGNVNNRDYFMFDSQAHGAPLFSSNQGTSYVLKCCCLKVLLACIVLTLNIKRHNVKFYIYAVSTKITDEAGRKKYEEEIANEQLARESRTEKLDSEVSTYGSTTNFLTSSTTSEIYGEDLSAENPLNLVKPSEFRIPTTSAATIGRSHSRIRTMANAGEALVISETAPAALLVQTNASVNVVKAENLVPTQSLVIQGTASTALSNMQANTSSAQVTTSQTIQQTTGPNSPPLTKQVKTPALRSTDQTAPMTSATAKALKLPLQTHPASLQPGSMQTSNATETPSPTRFQITSPALSAQSVSTTTEKTPSTSSKTKVNNSLEFLITAFDSFSCFCETVFCIQIPSIETFLFSSNIHFTPFFCICQ